MLTALVHLWLADISNRRLVEATIGRPRRALRDQDLGACTLFGRDRKRNFVTNREIAGKNTRENDLGLVGKDAGRRGLVTRQADDPLVADWVWPSWRRIFHSVAGIIGVASERPKRGLYVRIEFRHARSILRCARRVNPRQPGIYWPKLLYVGANCYASNHA